MFRSEVEMGNITQRGGFPGAVAHCTLDGQRLVIEMQRFLPFPQRFIDPADAMQRYAFPVPVADGTCNWQGLVVEIQRLLRFSQ